MNINSISSGFSGINDFRDANQSQAVAADKDLEASDTPAAASTTVVLSKAAQAKSQQVSDTSTTAGVERYAVPDWMSSTGYDLSQGGSAVGQKSQTNGFSRLSPSEAKEYNTRIQTHYQEMLKDNGIDTLEAHYQRLIVDHDSSDKLRQDMQNRINNDSTLVALMNKIGIGSQLTW